MYNQIVKMKILIIEDDKLLADMLKMNLQQNNYEVIIAEDGEDGLEKTHKENPDLIILDLMLPKLNGYMLCSILKKDKRYCQIPIILLSARNKEEVLNMKKKVKADAYVPKPSEFKTLLKKIEQLLKQEEE